MKPVGKLSIDPHMFEKVVMKTKVKSIEVEYKSLDVSTIEVCD